MEKEDLEGELPVVFRVGWRWLLNLRVEVAFKLPHILISHLHVQLLLRLRRIEQLPDQSGNGVQVVFLQFDWLFVLPVDDHIIASSEGEFVGDLIVFADSAVSLALHVYLLQKLAIAVHVDHRGPILSRNHEDLHAPPDLDAALLAGLEVLQFENCSLLFLHAGDQSLNIEVLLAEVVLDSVGIHEVEGAEIGRVGVWLGLLLLGLEGLGDDFGGRDLLEFEFDAIEAGWLVDAVSQPHDGLVDMQHFLLVEQLPLLDHVLGRFVVRQEILLVDRRQVRVVEVVRNFLLVDGLLALGAADHLVGLEGNGGRLTAGGVHFQ